MENLPNNLGNIDMRLIRKNCYYCLDELMSIFTIDHSLEELLHDILPGIKSNNNILFSNIYRSCYKKLMDNNDFEDLENFATNLVFIREIKKIVEILPIDDKSEIESFLYSCAHKTLDRSIFKKIEIIKKSPVRENKFKDEFCIRDIFSLNEIDLSKELIKKEKSLMKYTDDFILTDNFNEYYTWLDSLIIDDKFLGHLKSLKNFIKDKNIRLYYSMKSLQELNKLGNINFVTLNEKFDLFFSIFGDLYIDLDEIFIINEANIDEIKECISVLDKICGKGYEKFDVLMNMIDAENYAKDIGLEKEQFINKLKGFLPLSITYSDGGIVPYKELLSYKLSDSEIQILNDLKNKFNLENIEQSTIKTLSKRYLNGKEINLIKNLGLDNAKDIELFLLMENNINPHTIKEYIERKKNYLYNNRSLSNESFNKLFGKNIDIKKIEIKQNNLGLCYMYSAFELLKKMNGFTELMQTSISECEGGWKVRIPFNSTGEEISVYQNEIDNKYKNWLHNYNINSNTDSLGFKILEIAYIKKMMLKNTKDKTLTYDNILNNDNENTIELLHSIEGGHVKNVLLDLFGNVNGGYINLYELFQGIKFHENRVEKLKEINAPEIFLNKEKALISEYYSKIEQQNLISNLLFNYFKTGLIKIGLSCISISDIYGLTTFEKGFIIDDVKIIGEKNGERYSDIYEDEAGNKKLKIFNNHAYSIEKCYINKTGEKRVWIVNPWNTSIKYDISLNLCQKIFCRWDFTIIDIEHLFV